MHAIKIGANDLCQRQRQWDSRHDPGAGQKYRFKAWEGAASAPGPTVEVIVDGDRTLTAEFETN